MSLSTLPACPQPLVTTMNKLEDDLQPRNSLPFHSYYLGIDNSNSSSNRNNRTLLASPPLVSSVSTSTVTRKAMSVMSSSSYQYASTFVTDLLDDQDDSGSHSSINSAPTFPEDNYHLSKHDLASVMDAHRTLLASAEVFRQQLNQLSHAAANFGIALESVAKHKAVMDAGQGLQAAAGLQLLISNQHQVLADTMLRTFETPLSALIDEHESTIKQSQENYNVALQAISKKIRSTEAINLQQAKKGQRDLRQYRRTLQDLTRQVDELDHIKSAYHRRMQNLEEIYHRELLHHTGWLVRAQVDVYELLSSKGLEDPTLEHLIQQHPDPFSRYATVNDSNDSNDIFTVLPSDSLIDDLPITPTLTATTTTGTNRLELNQIQYSPSYDSQRRENSEVSSYFDQTPPLQQRQLPRLRVTPFLYTRPSIENFHKNQQQSSASTKTNKSRVGSVDIEESTTLTRDIRTRDFKVENGTRYEHHMQHSETPMVYLDQSEGKVQRQLRSGPPANDYSDTGSKEISEGDSGDRAWFDMLCSKDMSLSGKDSEDSV